MNDPKQILAGYALRVSRQNDGKAKFLEMEKLVKETNLAGAIDELVVQMAMTDSIPAAKLAKVANQFVIESLREKIVAALRRDLIEQRESDFKSFCDEHRSALKNFHSISV